MDSLGQARRIAALAQEKLAEDVVVLDMRSECTFTDYFVLLKVDGEWKIANKVWTRQPKPATP